jgi:hypothetical protein
MRKRRISSSELEAGVRAFVDTPGQDPRADEKKNGPEGPLGAVGASSLDRSPFYVMAVTLSRRRCDPPGERTH